MKALICGGSKGIGAACTRSFLQNGYQVTILSRSLGEFADNSPSGLSHISLDFSDLSKVKEVSNKLKSEKFDVLINNSGGPKTGAALDTELNEFEVAFNSHLYTSQILTQALTGNMKSNNFGRIINIISVTAKNPLENMCVSNTLRGAMTNWSKTLSKELASDGITVNNIFPGYTETQRLGEVINNAAQAKGLSPNEVKKGLINQIPAKRFGKPKELAELALFLASDKASYINGTSIPVDGGWTPTI